MSNQKIEVFSVDPVWGQEFPLEEIRRILPMMAEGVRTINCEIVYRGPVLLVTRYITADDFCMKGVWVLYLVSGKEPTVRQLLSANGHVSLFREVKVRCELSPQGNFLGQEAVVTLDTGTLPVASPEPIQLLIKE